MRCTVLASGSKGNSTVIEGTTGSLLIDAGLSARELLARMAAAGIDPEKINAILVTHEHGDHVKGLDVTARKLGVPIHATEGTLHDFLNHRRTSSKPIEYHSCRYGDSFSVGDFSIEPFTTSHDAAEPCGFVIREGDIRLGYCTDTGIVTDVMHARLARCDGLVLESNHCPEMLANGPYPESLKRRIRSKRGHLSNPAAAECLTGFGKDVPLVILAHLSEINNTPEKAKGAARSGLGLFFLEERVVIASQCGTAGGCPEEIRL